MKTLGRRLGRVMRWGVYLFTLVVTALFIWSFGLPRTVVRNSVYLNDGRLLLTSYDVSSEEPNDKFAPGSIHHLIMIESMDQVLGEWWALPGMPKAVRGDAHQVDLPLAYLSMLGLAFSARLYVHGRRLKRDPSDCAGCGYSLEGLESNTCPECGVERG